MFLGLALTPQVPTIKGPRGSSTLYSRYRGGTVRVVQVSTENLFLLMLGSGGSRIALSGP